MVKEKFEKSWETQGVCLIFFCAEDSKFFQTPYFWEFSNIPILQTTDSPTVKVPGILNSHLGGPFDDASIAPDSEDPKGWFFLFEMK